MFQRILTYIREWINKMLGQTTLKQALKVDIAISASMADALQTWSLMYTNQASWLKSDANPNGATHSLNLPAAIAGEIARSVTIEMSVDVTGSARADFLAEQMEGILPKLRQQVEYGCAKGGLMLKPYIKGDALAVDFVQADQFYPVAFDANGNITAAVFADQRTIGQLYYTRLEYHQMVAGGCRITNAAFRSSAKDTLGISVPLADVPDWAEIQEEATILNVTQPLFAYFKYPLANNIDPTSPLGVSCYARAADLIRDADVQWSDFLWEFESGRRALYADVQAFDLDANGKPILPFKRLYRTLNAVSQIGKGEELFKEWSPTLREQNIINGLETMYRQIEYNCGLAEGALPRPNALQANTLTATQIKMTQQRTFSTITDTQKALESALEDLLYAMDAWATLGKLSKPGAYEASYHWDDSILVDDTVRFAQDTQAQAMGAMPLYRFLMRNLDLSEEDARKWVQEAQTEKAPAPPTGANGQPPQGSEPNPPAQEPPATMPMSEVMYLANAINGKAAAGNG